MKRTRKVGTILLDLEKVLTELTDDHDLQFGDILNLVYGYLEVHHPESKEEYVEGGHPIFYYGPIDKQKK